MTNFIFKSPSDLQKISQQVKVLLNEQRHQRSDLNEIKLMLRKLTNEATLQKTVDEWYAKSPDTETCIAPDGD